ncbi:MAG: peptidoglycan DD-metalloendopeptidase family protein [Thermodesulfovibrionaceae bacterium]
MMKLEFTKIILILLIFSLSLPCFATKPQEELQSIKKELSIQKKKLEETIKTEQTVVEDLNRVIRELQELDRRIKTHKEKIKNIQSKVSLAENQIKTYHVQLESRKSYLANRIKIMQKISKYPDPTLLVIFETDTTKAFRVLRNLQKVSNIDKRIVMQYRRELNKLVAQQNELKNLLVMLKNEESSLNQALQQQKQKKKEKEVLLTKVRQQKVLYEQKIKELEENAKRLTKLLQHTEEQEKRAGKLDFTLKGEFVKKRGNLIWPVSGKVISRYGKQTDPVYNIPVFKSGIYIQASPGASVRAVADGKVVYAKYFKGYENLVIISHGEGYYTVYGNLGSMAVKEGSFIKAGQTIGTVGVDSNLGSAALYFEIRYRGKPLNPEQWLKS